MEEGLSCRVNPYVIVKQSFPLELEKVSDSFHSSSEKQTSYHLNKKMKKGAEAVAATILVEVFASFFIKKWHIAKERRYRVRRVG